MFQTLLGLAFSHKETGVSNEIGFQSGVVNDFSNNAIRSQPINESFWFSGNAIGPQILEKRALSLENSRYLLYFLPLTKFLLMLRAKA